MAAVKDQPIIRYSTEGYEATYRILGTVVVGLYRKGVKVGTELVFKMKWQRPDGTWSGSLTYLNVETFSKSEDWSLA